MREIAKFGFNELSARALAGSRASGDANETTDNKKVLKRQSKELRQKIDESHKIDISERSPPLPSQSGQVFNVQ